MSWPLFQNLEVSFINSSRLVATNVVAESNALRLLIYASSDTGRTWQQTFNELAQQYENWLTKPYASPGGTVLIDHGYYEYLRSDDYGQTWETRESPDMYSIGSFVNASPGVFFAGATTEFPWHERILKSVDDGLTWNLVWNDNSNQVRGGLYNVEFTDSLHGWFASSNGQAISTVDGGQSWQISQIALLTETEIHGLTFIDSAHGWAFRMPGPAESGGIYAFGNAANDVEPSATFPTDFSLTTFPNPFNASVRIDYELPRASDVRVSIHNTLGQQVATLFNGRANAGTHTLNWSPETASGVYLVKLVSGTFVTSRKILYIR